MMGRTLRLTRLFGIQHTWKPADIEHSCQGHCVDLPSESAARSVQPESAGADSSTDMAILGSCNHAPETSSNAHVTVERMLEQIQTADSTAAMSNGLQSREEPSPLLEGSACLIWLPHGQLSGDT